MKCCLCGKEFDESEYFENDYLYIKRKKNICPDCEIDLFNEEEEGYFESVCKECGQTIDLFEEYHEFQREAGMEFSNWHDLDFYEYFGFCRDCAMDKLRNYIDQLKDDFEEYGRKY